MWRCKSNPALPGAALVIVILSTGSSLFGDGSDTLTDQPHAGCLMIYPVITIDPVTFGTMHYDDLNETNNDWSEPMRNWPIIVSAGLGFSFWRVFYMNTKMMYQASAGGGINSVGAAADMDLYFFKRSPVRPYLHMGSGSLFYLNHNGNDGRVGYMMEIGAGVSARIIGALRVASKVSLSINEWDFSYWVNGVWPFEDYDGYRYRYNGLRLGLQVDFPGR